MATMKTYMILLCLLASQFVTAETEIKYLHKYINRHRGENCHVIKEGIPVLQVKAGDAVKVLSSKGGQYEISRPLASIKEAKRVCERNEQIESVGWVKGDVFEKWPYIILSPDDDGVIDKCFVIDGPANVREKPKGKIVGSLMDFDVSKIIERKGDWFLVSEPIENYAIPFGCLTSSKRTPVGWTHKSNLKYFPTPLIQNTSNGIKLLKIKEAISDSLPIGALGGRSNLEIAVFRNSEVSSEYWGGLVITRLGQVYPEPEAYLFNGTNVVKLDYKGDYRELTDKGFEIMYVGEKADDGSYEVIYSLILPNGKSEVIEVFKVKK